MPEVENLLKGLLIGLIFGIPAGAVGAMCVREAAARGFRAGLITGLGSSAADCTYALIGVLGLTVISDFLLMWQKEISIIGSILILLIAASLLRGRDKKDEEKGKEGNMFPQAFLAGITNPAAILTFLYAFSTFGIRSEGAADGVLLVMGIFLGTLIWWTALSAGVTALKRRMRRLEIRKLDMAAGIVLTLFAVIILIRALA